MATGAEIIKIQLIVEFMTKLSQKTYANHILQNAL